jgi:hypothetical protein
LIYLRKITNNNLINYEKIYLEYEDALESKELVEKEMVNILGPMEKEETCCSEGDYCSIPERNKKDL